MCQEDFCPISICQPIAVLFRYISRNLSLGQDFIGMHDSRFSSTGTPHHEGPKESLTFSGIVIINGEPSAKTSVPLSGKTVADKQGQSFCVDEVVETDLDGQYEFKNLTEGFSEFPNYICA